MSVDTLLKEVDALTAAERAEFTARLAEKYPDAADGVSPELAKLLDERCAEADANPNQGYTWDEVVAYVKRKK